MKEGRLIRKLLPESRYDSVDLIGINEGFDSLVNIFEGKKQDLLMHWVCTIISTIVRKEKRQGNSKDVDLSNGKDEVAIY